MVYITRQHAFTILPTNIKTFYKDYGVGLRNTAHAFVEALKVFDDAKRADRKDWKLKSEHKGDKCFNKHFPIGKVYYLKIENTPHWNSNVHSVDRLGTISEHADILHYTTSEVVVIKGRDFVVCRMWRKYTTSEVVVIKGRDFVVCRMWRKVGDSYVVCATSFENDVPIMAKKKRGWVNVCAGKFTPLASDPTKCTIEYIVSIDLRDKITPKALPHQRLSRFVCLLQVPQFSPTVV
ncbi:unnamed protein product [Strongylus vulgaris]|uniref:START domain-containing protein n=1 Tax=Strongylus vulgaris TaxID=40348 RepID=A0A3P7IP69_STRVU|nr:unnamed protein product [Strongylus vulgaris]